MVTADLAGSVLNGLDCQAVLPASSSPIELRGLERSKRVSFVIGLKSLVVVFGRIALVGSDRGQVALRCRSSARRVALVVVSVIGLIGLRALNRGIARSVSIGGSRRDERVSRLDVFNLDQGRDRNLPLGGGSGGGLFTGCEGGVGRERVLTGLGCVRRLSVIVQSLASKRRSRRVPRVFGDKPFSRCGVGRRSPAVVQAVLWDRLVSAQPRVGGDRPPQRKSRGLARYPAWVGIDRCRYSSACWRVAPFRCRPLPRVCGDRPPTHPRPEGILILDRTGSERSRWSLPRSSGDRPTAAGYVAIASRDTARAGVDPNGTPLTEHHPRSYGDRPGPYGIRSAPREATPRARGSTLDARGFTPSQAWNVIPSSCPVRAGILRRRGEVGRRVLAVREAC